MKTVETIRSEERTDWSRNAEFYRTDDQALLMSVLSARRQRYYGVEPGQRVLDLGCGSGATVAALRRAGIDAVGIDYAQAMVEVARQEYGLGSHVLCGVATDLPFDLDSFDVVIADGVLHHLAVQEELAAALREIRRVLQPGGTFCFFDRNGSLASALMHTVCIRVKEVLAVLTGRAFFPSCASRNEINFGGRRDLRTIEGQGFRLVRRKDVSTLPFFFCVVALNTVQYFVSGRIRQFLERCVWRPVSWLDEHCNWRWFSVEQMAVLAMVPADGPAPSVNGTGDTLKEASAAEVLAGVAAPSARVAAG